MQTARPRLYLHIGRNKVGSKTIQDYCLQHEEDLRKGGVRYALFGYPIPPGSDIPNFSSEFVRAQRSDAVLVSHEGICCWPAELTRGLIADLSDLDVQVIFYIRPYRDWVVSSYNFDVRSGFSGCDFDRYLEAIASRVSFLPQLNMWGDAFGWENIRVRSTHAADLQGGDLVSDFLAAMGRGVAPDRQVKRLNTSSSWMAVEMMRAVLGRDQATGWDSTRHALGQVLHYHTTEALKDCGDAFADAVYLPRRQAQELSDLYNRDLDFLTARTGVHLQRDDAQDAPMRAFLPSADRVPKNIVRMVRERTLDHPHAAELLNQAAFRARCEY